MAGFTPITFWDDWLLLAAVSASRLSVRLLLNHVEPPPGCVIPWREDSRQDQHQMKHQFILCRAWPGGRATPCPYLVPHPQLLDAAYRSSLGIKAQVALHGAVRKTRCHGRWLQEELGKSVQLPWSPLEQWSCSPHPIIGKFISSFSRQVSLPPEEHLILASQERRGFCLYALTLCSGWCFCFQRYTNIKSLKFLPILPF